MDNSNFNIDTARQTGWAQMETLLDKELKQKKRLVFLPYLPYAASLAILIAAGLFLLNQDSYQPTDFPQEIQIQPFEFEQFTLDFSSETKKITTEEKNIRSGNNENKAGLSVVQKSSLSVNSQLTQNRQVIAVTLPKELNGDINTKGIASSAEHPDKSQEIAVKSKQAQNRNIIFKETSQPANNGFVSNQPDQTYKTASLFEIKKTMQPNIDLGLKANGSIGFVSKDFEDYGVRLGFELKKPISNKLSANTGIRYSNYKDVYSSTYSIEQTENSDHKMISQLANRSVHRSFVEFPLYADYAINETIKLKAGGLVTYNKNNSSNTNISSTALINSSIQDDLKEDAGKLLGDKHGYLGEAVVGATIQLDKVSFDVEGNYGFISNQNIDNRSVVGVRLNYRFGR